MANKKQQVNKHAALAELYRDSNKTLDEINQKLKESGLSFEDLKQLFDNKIFYESVPLSIFNSDLSPLEGLVTFLSEKGHNINAIAKLLCRNNKTIWTAYYNAKKKKCKLNHESEYYVPLKIFCNRDLSILENLSTFLRDEMKFSFVKIGSILGKSKNTIWTTYKRGKDKQ